jgi:hypothetical protein
MLPYSKGSVYLPIAIGAEHTYNQPIGGSMMSGSNVNIYDEDGMRIVMLAVGTYGDVPLSVALGLGLRRARHRVCVATYEGLAAAIAHSFAAILHISWCNVWW